MDQNSVEVVIMNNAFLLLERLMVAYRAGVAPLRLENPTVDLAARKSSKSNQALSELSTLRSRKKMINIYVLDESEQQSKRRIRENIYPKMRQGDIINRQIHRGGASVVKS